MSKSETPQNPSNYSQVKAELLQFTKEENAGLPESEKQKPINMVADFRAYKVAEFKQKENQFYDAKQGFSILNKLQEELIGLNSSIVNETQNYLDYPRNGIESLVNKLRYLPEFIDELKSNINYLEYKEIPEEIIESVQLQLRSMENFYDEVRYELQTNDNNRIEDFVTDYRRTQERFVDTTDEDFKKYIRDLETDL